MEKVLENTYQTNSLDTVSRKSANLIPVSSGSNVAAGIAGGGPSGSGGGGVSATSTILPVQATNNALANATVLTSNMNATGHANTSAMTANLLSNASNGQSTNPPHQQIIQVSSQGPGSIVPGQQLMVQTFQGRQAIQIRAQGGQQIQQIQFIPINTLPGQPQRQPVIIQQQSPSVLHSAVGGQSAITSMANLAHSNVAKITGVQPSLGSKPSPVIIQQSGALLHGQATAHGLHHHNVAKITTVSRTPTGAVRTQGGKMINISTAGIAHHITGPAGSNNHTTVTTTTLPAGAQAAGGQVTRLGIISQLPANAHGATVSTVHGGKPILNLTTATLAAAKSVILNPAGSVVQPAIVSSSGTMHNVVGTFNGPATQFKQQTSVSGTNLLPTVMTLATLTTTANHSGARHTLITTQPATSVASVSATQAIRSLASGIVNQTVNISSAGNPSTGSISITTTNALASSVASISAACSSSIPPSTITHNANHNLMLSAAATNHAQDTLSSSASVVSHLPSSITASTNQMSSIRPNILSSAASPLNSPIKQPIGQQTPSSPRPSILIRKRVAALTNNEENKSSSGVISSGQLNSSNATLNNSNASGVSSSSIKLLNSLGLTSKQVSSQHPNSGTSAAVRACDFSTSNPKLVNSGTLKRAEDHLTALNLSTVTNASVASTNRSNYSLDSNRHTNHTNENSVPVNQLNNCSNSANDSNASALAITPRKRRKQLLEPFTLTTSQNIKLLNSGDELKSNLYADSVATGGLDDDYLKKNKDQTAFGLNSLTSDTPLAGATQNACNNTKRPRPSLLTSYNVTWRSLQNHFMRHCEVKVKPDNRRQLSLNDQQSVEAVQKRNGWKVHHLGVQLRDLIDNESSHNKKLHKLLDVYDSRISNLPDKVKKEGQKPYNRAIAHNSITILDKLSDLIKANIQRSNLFQDQIRETNQILLKLTNEHKERVNKLAKRCSGKRANSSNREKNKTS